MSDWNQFEKLLNTLLGEDEQARPGAQADEIRRLTRERDEAEKSAKWQKEYNARLRKENNALDDSLFVLREKIVSTLSELAHLRKDLEHLREVLERNPE